MTTAAENGFQLTTDVPGTLGIIGVLDFDTAAAALQAMQAGFASGKLTQLDLAGISRSDSAGLACVLAVVAAADRHGHALRVVHMPAGMQALATVCEVDRLLR